MTSRFFTPEEFVRVDNEKEFMEAFDYYLNQPRERNAIVLKGMRRMFHQHTYFQGGILIMTFTIAKKNLVADLYLAWLHNLDLMRLYVSRSNKEMGYYNLLFSIAIAAHPRVVLELGTGPGLSSLAFARALQYYRKCSLVKGVLHTCDIDPDAIRRLRRYLNFGTLVMPHPVSTDELAVQWAKQPVPIDLLFIDAYHSHEQSLKDFKHFASYVVPNGLVIMHDTFPLSEQHEQIQYSGTVWKTAQSIKKDYREDFEIMTIPYLCGISLLRKKGAKYF